MSGRSGRRGVRRALAGCASAVGLALVGCWGAPAIDRQGLVALLGVDSAGGGRFQVTADIINAQGLPSPTGMGQGAGAKPVFLRSAEGDTVAQAVTELARTAQTSLDLTHLEGIVVSEDLARQGLTPLLNYFGSTGELTATAWLFVSRGQSAASLMQVTKNVPPQPGTSLLQTALYGERQVAVSPDRIESLQFRSSQRGDDFATVGVTSDTQHGAATEAGFRLTGMAVFDGERLAGWLDPPATDGWLLLTGRLRSLRITVNGPYGPFTAKVVAAHRRIRVTSAVPVPRVDITAIVTAHLLTMPPRLPWPLTDTRASGAVESEIASALWLSASQALHRVQALHSDTFALGQHVRAADAAYWARYGPTWESGAFPALPVHLSVHATIEPPDSLCPPNYLCGPGAAPAAP